MKYHENPNPLLEDYDRARAFLRRHLAETALDGSGVTSVLILLNYLTKQMCDIAKPINEKSEVDKARELANRL